MFKKILNANRGQIACRVIKTARRMGGRMADGQAAMTSLRTALPNRASA